MIAHAAKYEFHIKPAAPLSMMHSKVATIYPPRILELEIYR